MHRNIRILTWFNFCLDFRVYNAVAVVFFEQVTHSWALAGLVFAIAKVASAAFDVPTGILSDMLNRKATLVLGQFASVLAVTSYALAHTFALLSLGALFEGLSFALFSGNNDALLYDTLTAEDRVAAFPEYLGRLSAMFQFALATSALVATVALLAHASFRALFWISVAPQVLGVILALALIDPKRPAGTATKIIQHLRDAFAVFRADAKLRTMSLASIIGFGLGEAKFLTLPAFFALFWPAWALGVGRFLSHVLAGTGFRFAGRVVERWSAPVVLIAGAPVAIGLGLGAISAANAASPALYAAASLPFGPTSIAQASLLQKSFSDRQRATMASLVSFLGALFMAIAVFLLGVLADRIGMRYALLTVEILSISVPYLYWRLFGRHPRGAEPL